MNCRIAEAAVLHHDWFLLIEGPNRKVLDVKSVRREVILYQVYVSFTKYLWFWAQARAMETRCWQLYVHAGTWTARQARLAKDKLGVYRRLLRYFSFPNVHRSTKGVYKADFHRRTRRQGYP